MEILQLRYFYETSKNESIAKTAEKFMVPASSVSASIKRLENEVGVTLFDRYSNKIKLNDKGFMFAESLGDIFDKLENTLLNFSEKTTEQKEICILIKARRKWITDLIIKYKKTHPDVQFKIYNDIHMDDTENFDIIVDEQSDIYDNMEKFIISVEEICIKASKDSSLVGRKLSFNQLKNVPFVMPRKAIGIRKLLDNTGNKHGFKPNIAIECNDSYCLSRYVEADMGITLGSRRALNDSIEKNIVPLDITDFSEVQIVCVYHRKTAENDINLKSFCDFLNAEGKNIKLI